MIAGVAVFATFALAVFAIVYARTERTRALNGTAILLALLAVAIVAIPGVVPWIASHSGNPDTVGDEIIAIALELLVPSVLAVLVQWGLVRRRHLQMAGEDDLTLWPWVTTVVAAFVILNPYGLAFLQATLKRTAGDMMWQFIVSVTAGSGLRPDRDGGDRVLYQEAPDRAAARRSSSLPVRARACLTWCMTDLVAE